MSRGHDELTTATVLKTGPALGKTYVTARFESLRGDLQLIRRYDKRGKPSPDLALGRGMDRLAVGSTNKVDLRSTHFKDLGCPQEGPAYTEAFLTVLRQVSKEEVVQYILALLDDMITGEMFL